MSEAGLRSLVSIVLSSPAISKINFKLRGYLIYQEGFSRVKSAVRSGQISVAVDDAAIGSDQAAYRFKSNTIILKSSAIKSTAISIDVRASIVHECLHALFDMDRIDFVSPFEEEACAGLTSAIYTLHHTGKHYIRKGSRFFRKGATVHSLAEQVSRSRGTELSSDPLFQSAYLEAGDIYLDKYSWYGKRTGLHNGI